MATMIAADIPYTADEIPIVKTEIRRGTIALREEVTAFIEHQATLSPTQRARLPMFFVSGFNFLKEECASIGHTDTVLDWLPRAVEIVLLTESGPSETFPKVGSDGMLTEPETETGDSSLWTQIGRFFVDVTEYVRNAFQVTGRLPRLPHAYIMTLIHFQRMFQKIENKTEHNFSLMCNIPNLMQHYITQALGAHNVPANYIKRGSDLEYHQF
uniref:Uncharacterized protein n=1 Tax=Caenorhabditis japonica TaxID=281687 RepID=A0A8R1EHN1_CAEJA